MGGDIRKMFMLGQKIKLENPSFDLIDLSLGNPDLEPPLEVLSSLKELLMSSEKGHHRYMDSAGLLEVRDYLAKELSKSEKTHIAQDSVYLTVGAAGGIQILLRTFIEENDEVIIFAPYFPEYIPYVENYNAKPIIVKCDKKHEPILDDLRKKISSKTKMVLMNSPNNPSGIAYSKKTIEGIVHILEEIKNKKGHVIQLVSDEPYSRVIYDESKVVPLMNLYAHSWLVRSFSKDLGLAGERIGFIAWRGEFAFPEIINAFRNASRVLGFVSAPRLMQRIIPVAYNAKVDVQIYKNRVESFIRILSGGGIETIMPDAGFFVFPKCPVQNEYEFCEGLVKKGVLCVPGSGFGCPGFFRASLTQEQSRVEDAAHRIVQFVKNK
ncbi:hypothetical protein AXG55_09690 [Silvanigrella aquatica]|uniref:Aminotransferase n=2 Tax=Silvanigrella aquatica TaxID=1915309 RepID=A0A1L4D4L8_9BACT|nr:hypothetical protein AXG55_09690 [Silvanigrella aquatica]